VLNSGFYNPERTVFANSARTEAARRAASYLSSAAAQRQEEIGREAQYDALLTEQKAEAKAARYGSTNFGAPGTARPSAASPTSWAGAAAGGLSSLAANAKGLAGMFGGGSPSVMPWSGSAAFTPGTAANSFSYAPRTPFAAPSLNASSVKFNPKAFTMPSLLGGG